MHWYIIQTDHKREFTVDLAIKRFQIETFLPTEVRSKRIGRNVTNRRSYFELPILPKNLFVKTYPETLDDLTTLRYVTGATRNAFGEALGIPDRQMLQFIAHHEEWFQRALNAAQRGTQGKPRKPKKINLADLADKSVFASVMTELFGIEQEQQAA